MSAPKFSIIVPVFGSTVVLDELLKRLTTVANTLDGNCEFIFVDDRGADKTWDILLSLAEKYPTLSCIRLANNFGQHNALMCGFAHAEGEIIVTLDDDLQYPPEEIPKLLAALTQDIDVVYGVPEVRAHKTYRNLGSSFVQNFYRRTFRLQNSLSSFRVVRRPIIQAIINYNKNYTFIDGLIAWQTRRITEVKIFHLPRQTGRSGYSLIRLISLAINMVTNFSLVPLQVSSVVGSIASFLAFFAGLFLLSRFIFFGVPVPGYTSVILAITFLSGLQLLVLGLIGEYLGRVHININGKPQYRIERVLLADGKRNGGGKEWGEKHMNSVLIKSGMNFFLHLVP